MRSGTETAFGGSMLGMSMPLVVFGFTLALGQGDVVGLTDAPLALPFGGLIVTASGILAAAGATLLWWRAPIEAPAAVRFARRPPRRDAVRKDAARRLPRSRRREFRDPAMEVTQPVAGRNITTRLIASTDPRLRPHAQLLRSH